MTDQTKKGWLIPIITSIITSLAVMAGAWFSLQGSVGSSSIEAESRRLETAFKRIEYLETQMKQQQVTSNAKIIELTTQVFKLQSQLNKDLNIRDMFEAFMDTLPFDAWLKKVVKDDEDNIMFEMVYINDQYQFNYGVSEQRYQGNIDTRIWGESVSEQFYKNDLRAYNSRSSLITYETFPERISQEDSFKRVLVMKMYLELIEGEPLIFGMTLDVDERQIQ